MSRAVRIPAMKTIEIPVSDAEYEAIRAVAEREERPLSDWAHEALISLLESPGITVSGSAFDLPTFSEPRQVAPLPSREELYDEIFRR